MLPPIRQKKMIRLLSERSFCSLEQLSQELNASIATVRRDLNSLQEQGIVRRTHGGAMFLGDREALPLFQDRQSMMSEAKMAIGKRAAQLVEEGDTIIIDGGTTPYQVAMNLQHKAIQVVTNSLPVANLFSNSRHVQVICTGGLLYPGSGVFLGSYAVDTLKSIRAQKAFIGVAGITEEGLYNSNALVVETEKAILAAAAEVYVVADQTKFDRHALAYLCGFDRIKAIITDQAPANTTPLSSALTKNSVGIILHNDSGHN